MFYASSDMHFMECLCPWLKPGFHGLVHAMSGVITFAKLHGPKAQTTHYPHYPNISELSLGGLSLGPAFVNGQGGRYGVLTSQLISSCFCQPLNAFSLAKSGPPQVAQVEFTLVA